MCFLTSLYKTVKREMYVHVHACDKQYITAESNIVAIHCIAWMEKHDLAISRAISHKSEPRRNRNNCGKLITYTNMAKQF